MLLINLLEAFSSLWANKQRSMLALLGITIGISSVIAMVSVGAMVQREALSQFRELGSDFVTVGLLQPKEGMNLGAMVGMPLPATRKLSTYVPGLVQATPLLIGGSDVNYGGKTVGSAVVGITGEFFRISKLRLAAGRQVGDLDGAGQFCVLGEKLCRDLGLPPNAQCLGQTIKLGDRLFVVAGVLLPAKGSGMEPYNANSTAFLPMAAAQQTCREATISVMIGRANLDLSVPQMVADVKRYFTLYAGGMQVQVNTAEELIAQMAKQARMFSLLLGAIGAIALVVGGVGVMNVMLVSVTERRQEIGLRRAMGATRAAIRGQFLIESVTLCLIGGLLGTLTGIGVSYGVAHFSHWDFFLTPNAILAGVCVSSFVGVFFGLFPAIQASKVDIIASLRSG